MTTKKLEGKTCYLSPVRLEDADKYYEWLNDAEVAINLRVFPQIITLHQEKNILADLPYMMGISNKTTNTLIGNCGLTDVDFINRSAEYGIFIGDKSVQGKGFGEEATRLMLDFAFNALNLYNIWVRVFSFNKRSLNLFRKCGFKIIGRRREAKIIGGQKYDEILMDLLASEYTSVYIQNLLK